MKTLFPNLLVAIALAAIAVAQTIPGRTLLWADEFAQDDGSKPESSNWGYDLGDSGWGNNELQHYTDRSENSRIENGCLVIEARAENFGARNFTSARLLTKDKASWTYGRIEARIKIPKGQGIWPAFWMLGANIGSAGWPNCGEIDVMENIGSLPSTLYGTIHGPGYSGSNGISGNTVLAGAALGDDFHVYAIEWEENRLRWFLDGQQFFTLIPGNLPNGSAWVFNAPQFIILNLAVGGNWPGSPNGSTVLPQRMTVDYVRVYAPAAAVPQPTTVTVDPAESWLGYMHVSDLPANGGAHRSGDPWTVPDLRSSFSGSTLTLSPNTINDPAPYWYIGGGGPGRPGNKIMSANMYVEKTDSLSGRTVTFGGTVSSNSLTSAHSAIAFIRDFAADYSSFTTTTAPLIDGAFSINHQTSQGSGRHVQYGFEITGVNVWPTDAGPFGSVQISPFVATPFSTWMSGFDFSAFSSPDLSLVGDPDGDGFHNFKEFALNDNPRSAAISGKVRSRIENVAGGLALVITLPVRGNPDFSGTPGKSASVDQVSYHIEGSNGLVAFDQNVTEIPVSAVGLPMLDPGWNYRTFRLDGNIGDPPLRGPTGYLRVRLLAMP